MARSGSSEFVISVEVIRHLPMCIDATIREFQIWPVIDERSPYRTFRASTGCTVVGNQSTPANRHACKLAHTKWQNLCLALHEVHWDDIDQRLGHNHWEVALEYQRNFLDDGCAVASWRPIIFWSDSRVGTGVHLLKVSLDRPKLGYITVPTGGYL